MKKITLILVALIGINFCASAQSSGDYRSIGNGNWNDPTKWQIYNGSNWISTANYPGQNPGTGAVTISVSNEIKITQSVPHPVASLLVDLVSYTPPESCPTKESGFLTFSAENAVSLRVTGGVIIYGELKIEDLNGSKTHTLFIGRNLTAGTILYDEVCSFLSYAVGIFQTVNQDDALNVTFKTTEPNCSVWGPNGISFYDITFDGTGIRLETPISVSNIANFINGIVIANGSTGGGGCDANDCYPYHLGGSLNFKDVATAVGASSASFVDGLVSRSGNFPFTFPIGSQGVFAPLTVSSSSSPAGHSAKYLRSSGSALGAISDPGLHSISNCENWILYSGYNPGGYNVDVTVGWTSASGCGPSPYVANVSEVRLAHFDETTQTWNSHGGNGIGTSTNGSVTWLGAAASGRYTFGNLNTNCIAPSGLVTSNIATTAASVSWSNVSGSESYDVQYKPKSSGSWIIAASAITSTSMNLSGLLPTVTYEWRVRANCTSTSSAYRQTEFTTLPACGSPSGLTTTNITSSSATLNWQPVPDAVNYDVQHKRSSYSSNYWKNVATATTSTSVNLLGLQPWMSYDWRVRANCTEGPGNYTQATFATFATPPPCSDTPRGLITTNISSNRATVSWNPVANAGYYHVSYKQTTELSWSTVAVFGTLYDLNGLTASTQYDWKVTPFCLNGSGTAYVSGYSVQSSFTTTATPPVCDDIYENNNTSGTAKTIVLGTTISASISSAADVDWFKVTMPNDSRVGLSVILSNMPADYDLYVYTKNLQLVGSSTTTGNESVNIYTATRKATYYIKVVGKNGAYNNSQCYGLLANTIVSGSPAYNRLPLPGEELSDVSSNQFLYPNPAPEFVWLRFNSVMEGSVDVQILNTVGQLVKKYPVGITKGYNLVKIPVNDIGTGVYLLRIYKGELSMIRKFVIAR